MSNLLDCLEHLVTVHRVNFSRLADIFKHGKRESSTKVLAEFFQPVEEDLHIRERGVGEVESQVSQALEDLFGYFFAEPHFQG